MNTQLHLPGTELSKYSSTRDNMEWLIQQAAEPQKLEQARQIILGWAQDSCQQVGQEDRFVFLDPDRDISFHEVLGKMDLPQAKRFIDELIEDIVPQLASQRQLFDDIRQGYSVKGSAVQGDQHANIIAALASTLEELGELDEIRQLFSSVETQVQRLTWVDDHKRNAKINMKVQFNIDEDINKEPGRSLKF